MRNKELLILNHLYANSEASQRDIALATGISLGNTNLIIKNLCRDGLLRQEVASKRKIKYLLTQRGIAERTRLFNENIISTLENYKKIRKSVAGLIDRLYERGYREFVLEGERALIYDVISDVFNDQFRDKASLMWGPAEEREGLVVLNVDRRFLAGKDVVNVLHEITV